MGMRGRNLQDKAVCCVLGHLRVVSSSRLRCCREPLKGVGLETAGKAPHHGDVSDGNVAEGSSTNGGTGEDRRHFKLYFVCVL